MTVAGVVVLLINDHLLKQTWPGFVTGKLSDVAGLLVAPALLALFLPRRADLAATVLTGVVFAGVKTTETGADLASQVWTFVGGPSRVLADPSDLLALPALALAWWVRERGTGPDRRHVMIVTMPLAVLAVTAASAAPGGPAAVAVHEEDGRITVRTDASAVWSSEDGGRSWTERPGGHDGESPRSAQCVPYQATRCYRVAEDRMAVEQSDDGGRTWRPSWAASPDDLERLGRLYGVPDESCAAACGLASAALAVQHRPEGHVVIVANGVAGILVRDPSGDWRQVGWPGAEPPTMDLVLERNVALFLAACMLFGGVGAGLRRYAGVYTGFAATACLCVPVVAGDLFSPGGSLPFLIDGPGWVLVLAALVAIPVSTVGCLVLAVAGNARAVPVAVGTLGAPLVYLSVYAPFHGWAQGTPDSPAAATALAVLLTAVVMLAGAALVRNDARRAYLAGTSTSSPT
ncbi:hypothetical protein C1J01_14065 [Nonomuraea aridisoli]|uniref:Uncharacterized protein n=1 Tax=Nonomuraea aridisoli TaxID=2070368 RepID=A0A2W2F1S3_9ACTN|nr:hypothetical protein C1J01_14065 [Nonomuraea aridisoli]